MKTESPLFHRGRLFIYFLTALGCASFLDPFKFAIYPPAFAKTGFIPLLLSALFMIAAHSKSQYQLGSAGQYLKTNGIYGLSRNPLELGFLLFFISLCLLSGSLLTWIPTLYFIHFANKYLITPKESRLRQSFGEEFTSYCHRVRRWL